MKRLLLLAFFQFLIGLVTSVLVLWSVLSYNRELILRQDSELLRIMVARYSPPANLYKPLVSITYPTFYDVLTKELIFSPRYLGEYVFYLHMSEEDFKKMTKSYSLQQRHDYTASISCHSVHKLSGKNFYQDHASWRINSAGPKSFKSTYANAQNKQLIITHGELDQNTMLIARLWIDSSEVLDEPIKCSISLSEWVLTKQATLRVEMNWPN